MEWCVRKLFHCILFVSFSREQYNELWQMLFCFLINTPQFFYSLPFSLCVSLFGMCFLLIGRFFRHYWFHSHFESVFWNKAYDNVLQFAKTFLTFVECSCPYFSPQVNLVKTVLNNVTTTLDVTIHEINLIKLLLLKYYIPLKLFSFPNRFKKLFSIKVIVKLQGVLPSNLKLVWIYLNGKIS